MAQESRLVIVIDAKNAERNARNLGNELDSIERKGDFATKSMDALSVATRQLAGYMAGLVTVSAAINRMDLYTGINNKLKLVTNSQEELNRAMADTFDIAQRSASSITGSVADMFKTIGGEQSKAYKIMFAAEKAFAIARSIMAIQTGIAEAAANPFPYNLAAMASVAASTASIVANIQSVASVGFSSGGYTGDMGRGDVAGVVHGQEYVLNAAATKRVGVDTLNAINSGQSLDKASTNQPIVNIYNLPGQTAEVTQNDDGSLDVRIRQIAGEVAEKVFLQGIQNPNSRISKAFKQNYNATPRRQ